MDFALAIALVAFCAMALLLWNRGAVVAVLLLPASEMLGFVDPMVFAVKGAFDIHSLAMGVVIVMLLAGMARLGDLFRARFFAPFIILAALWLAGVSMPPLRGESSWFQALEASKEFMMILLYPATFLFLRTSREVRVAWWLLVGLGAYYCALEIIAQVAGVSLLHTLTYFFRPDDFGLWKVYVQFWAVILYFFLYYVFRWAARGDFRPAMLLLGSAGMFLTFYRSYMLATMVAVPAVLLLARAPMLGMLKAGIGGFVTLFAVVATAAVFVTGRGGDVGGVADALVFSGIEEISRDSGGSLDGRREHSADLYRLAEQRPGFGYGFVNQEAPLAAKLNLPGFSASVLGFVDKGSADVLVKFGYVGGATLYLAFFWMLLRAIGIAKRHAFTDVSSKALSIAAVILISFIVQPVHAPLTYSFALLPLALALGIVDRERFLAEEDAARGRA